MKSRKTLVATAVATIAGLGFTLAAGQAVAAKDPNMEKCYGIAKAAMNDCGAKGHACSGQSAADSSPNEWLYVPKGTCDKIVGGSLKPQDKK